MLAGTPMTTDTIVAQATAPYRGGVGIIRVSGPLATQVALEVTGKTLKPRYAEYLPLNHSMASRSTKVSRFTSPPTFVHWAKMR